MRLVLGSCLFGGVNAKRLRVGAVIVNSLVLSRCIFNVIREISPRSNYPVLGRAAYRCRLKKTTGITGRLGELKTGMVLFKVVKGSRGNGVFGGLLGRRNLRISFLSACGASAAYGAEFMGSLRRRVFHASQRAFISCDRRSERGVVGCLAQGRVYGVMVSSCGGNIVAARVYRSVVHCKREGNVGIVVSVGRGSLGGCGKTAVIGNGGGRVRGLLSGLSRV